MFVRILTGALFAGFLAGLAAAALQLQYVQPLLLEAELYESGEVTHFEGSHAETSGDDGHEHAHEHRGAGGFDPIRDGLSALFSALIYFGYALMMVAAMAYASERGASMDVRRGLLWGIAGWASFQFAPAIGLPPELPGSAAADLVMRQIWWSATALVTCTGLALIAYGRGMVAWGAGALLLLAPHAVGAPHPGDFAGPVPPELAAEFATRALGVGLVAWAVMGCLAGHFMRRGSEVAVRTRTA